VRRERREAATAGLLPLASGHPGHAGRVMVGPPPQVAPRARPTRVRWGRYLVLGAAVYCVWVGRIEWGMWHRLAAQAAHLRAEAAVLRQQQAVLRAEVAYAGTDAYIEAQARQQFGMVGPGEVPLAPETSGTVTASGSAAGPPQASP
jgi:cell division protein FtsB